MSGDEASHEIPCNLDPAVAALIEPLRDGACRQEYHTRIAHIRLRQEHVRGNATYAAKILEQTLRDTKEDRKAYELLASRLEQLEMAVARLPADNNSNLENRSVIPSKNGDAAPPAESSSQKDGKQNDSSPSSLTTTAEMSADQIRIQELELLVHERLEQEILHCQEDQTTLREQEQRLRSRIQSLQKAVQQQTAPTNRSTTSTSRSRRKLEEGMASLLEYTTTRTASGSAECVICHDRAAVRAVIPCGHLCLCDPCTPTLVDSALIVPYCPMCRGSFLSTLKIYAAK